MGQSQSSTGQYSGGSRSSSQQGKAVNVHPNRNAYYNNNARSSTSTRRNVPSQESKATGEAGDDEPEQQKLSPAELLEDDQLLERLARAFRRVSSGGSSSSSACDDMSFCYNMLDESLTDDENLEIHGIMEVCKNANKSNNANAQSMSGFNVCIDLVQFQTSMFSPETALPAGLAECIYSAIACATLSHAARVREPPVNSKHYNPSSNQHGKGSNRLSFTDFTQFIAVVQKGTLKQQAALAFRIYDVVQNGVVTKEGVSRFINAIHGQDYVSSAETKRGLIRIFQAAPPGKKNTTTVLKSTRSSDSSSTSTSSKSKSSADNTDNKKSLSSGQQGSSFVELNMEEFIHRVEQYATIQNNKPSHFLVDWLRSLVAHIIPQSPSPEYTQQLSKFPRLIAQPQGRELHMLCARYRITPILLFEVKRKYHSILANSNPVPIMHATKPAKVLQEGRCETEADGNSQPKESRLDLDAWLNAVNVKNDMGGGYLPISLAKLVFLAGCRTTKEVLSVKSYTSKVRPSLRSLSQEYLEASNSPKDETEKFPGEILPTQSQNCTENDVWTLYDFVSFGGLSIRGVWEASNELKDDPLVEFTFRVFAGKHDYRGMHYHETSIEKLMMDRKEVENMIMLLVEHVKFRRSRDAPLFSGKNGIIENTDETSCESNQHENGYQVGEASEASSVEESILSSLGFLPKSSVVSNQQKESLVNQGNTSGGSSSLVSVSYVVHGMLLELGCAELDGLSFDAFVRWIEADRKCRLAQFFTELRVISGSVFGVRPATPLMERSIIEEVFRRHKQRHPPSPQCPRGPDETVWHLISSNWWKQWLGYSKHTQPAPNRKIKSEDFSRQSTIKTGALGVVKSVQSVLPPIDNHGLLRLGSLALKPNLLHLRDFELIPPMAWSALQAWHDGGPPISRQVVRQLSDSTFLVDYEVELYPFCLTIALADATTAQPRPFQQWALVSRTQPASMLIDNLCSKLKAKSTDGRLWRIPANNNDCRDYILLNIIKPLGAAAEIEDGCIVMLELKNSDGTWPRDEMLARKAASNDNSLSNDAISGDGLVGLYNMGNTCYLNSSVQCLSHTPILKEYFATKAYINDINQSNPTGHQGRLAQVTATLVCELWKGTSAGLTPATFKDSIAKFNNHFAGNDQHDAQELLAFLLDGLSEDLNRVVDKPYIEQPDSDGRPDHELAEIWWKNHLRREMSIIVAIFTGQYKSLLTCGTCGYESARFEPFMYLQLPLPEDGLVTLTIVLHPWDNKRAIMRYSVRVCHDGSILDALVALAKVVHDDEQKGVDKSSDVSLEEKEKEYNKIASNLAVVEVRDHRIQSITPHNRNLSQLREADVMHVFELESLKPHISLEKVQHEEKNNAADDDNSSNPVPEDEPNEKLETSVESGMITKKKILSSPSAKYSNAVEEVISKIPTVEGSNGMVNVKAAAAPAISNSRPAYIAIAQRRLEPIPRPFLFPFSVIPFGTPLLLRLDLECTSGRDMYDLIAKRMVRHASPNCPQLADDLTPFQVSEILLGKSNKKEELTCVSAVSNSGKVEEPDKIRCGQRAKKRNPITADSEHIVAGPLTRYGFRLRLTSRDGKRCSRCTWLECCIGCEIPDDDAPTIVKDGDTISLDWHLESTAMNIDEGVTNSVVRHSTCVGANGMFAEQAITLEDCLDKFAQAEEIPEAYCSKCKDFQESTKCMGLWRLPPVMIIHLKRFQYNTQTSRKLRNLVKFPIDRLDLGRIVQGKAKNGNDGENVSTDKESPPNEDNDESLYDLYGIVHHLGALHGGHYVASLRSEYDNKWRLFNDATISEISEKDIVDASAYILFYVRRDIKDVQLHDFWDTTFRQTDGGVTEEEIDQLVRQRERCIIS